MALGMCRTKFYASGLFLKSYRAHQQRFDICVALKRVTHRRIHQHCRKLSEQHRTTRSRFEMDGSQRNSPLNELDHSMVAVTAGLLPLKTHG